jgi:hypothetical protein
MANHNKYNRTWLAAIGLGSLFSLTVIWTAFATNEPVLTITPTGTNHYQIVITNGTNTGKYELYHRALLVNPAYPWTLISVGTAGQTNWTVDGGPNGLGFFMVGVGNDWDSDGVPNSQDANPTNANIGALSITIDSPTNGMVIL